MFLTVHNIGIMDIRVILLCIAAVYGGTPQRTQYYKSHIAQHEDTNADSSNEQVVLDQFSYFKNLHSFDEAPPLLPSASEIKPIAHPIHFSSSFNSDGSEGNAYKIQKYLADQTPKATDEEPYTRRSFRQSYKPRNKPNGKSSYPAKGSNRRTEQPSASAMQYYTDLYSKQKDVEMILPKEKSIILPMVNGKPKPYQGYRAAPDSMPYGSDDGDIIYGKPKKGVESIRPYRIKRSPAEYHGGIHPHFDYSDPENAARIAKAQNQETTNKSDHQKRGYPKKHRSKISSKPYNYYKYPKGESRRTNKRSSDEQTEEDEDEEQSEEQEDEHKIPPYKYKYDSTFVIPQLEIKYYPYERELKNRHKDNKEEGTEDEETYESKIDEYTAGYEAYKKSLPTDLESYFGKPDFGDYNVEATENLEENKNCEKITRQPSENATEETNGRTETCYICRDPKTGGSYEQCAYQSEPKSEKYYYGGTKSFQTDESPEPVSYRYRRSTFGDDFDLDHFIFGDRSNTKRKARHNPERSIFDKPKKRYKKNWQSDSRYDPYGSYRDEDHYGSPSSRRKAKNKKEGPPSSYDGPKYTYEGPKHPYEGPAETYEGPINKEYYITSDDRIENDEAEESDSSQQNEESQSKPKKEFYEYNTYHPDRRYSQSSRRSKYAPRDTEEVEDEEDYRPDTSYTSDYRFGPEHFVDDEVEEEQPREKQKSESRPKPAEKRQKHSGSESRQAASTDAEEKDSGNVKVFKNGDVCRKKKVDGMICMVCKNEKTAATYEQCQYSSKPKDKYYAYGSQKSYRTSDPDAERGGRGEEDEDQRPEKSDVIEKKILITKQSKVFQDNSGPLESLPSIRSIQGDLLGSPSDNLETHLYNPNQNDTNNNRQVSESIMRIEPRDGIEGLEEYLYSDNEDSDKKATDEDREYRSYDDYFHDIFPEFSNKKERNPYSEESRESDEDDEAEESEESESERHVNFDPFSNIRKFKDDSPSFLDEYSVDEEESGEASNEEPLRLKDKKSRVPSDFFLEDSESEEYHKKDIEKALGEFQSRDWSNCKKIMKNKLTCYQCVDKNGVNNEECMYVEASQPMKKHMAYHERKELRPETIVKDREEVTEQTQKEVTSTDAPKRKMRRPKNAKETVENVTEPVEETRRRPIGDYEGVPKVPEEDVMTPVPSLTTESVAEDTTEKSQTRATIKRQQKRIKTSKKAVEVTTEWSRKRKQPVRKFDDAANITDATENVSIRPTADDSVGVSNINNTNIK